MTTKTLAKYVLFATCFILLIVLFTIFKYFPPNGKLVCSLKSAPGDTYALYTYTINFKLWKATSFLSEERLVSKDTDLLKTIEEDLKVSLEKDNKLEYFNNEMKLLDNELVIRTKIDYKLLKQFVKNNHAKPKIGIISLKKSYTNVGANCKYQ